MIKIEIGKNFPLTKVCEGSMVDLKEEGLVVFIGLDDIIEKEIENFRKKQLTLDIAYINDIIFFVLNIDEFIISDIPFHTGLIRPESSRNTVIKRSPENIYNLHIYLVDIVDNTLKAMRFIGLTEEFSSIVEMLLNKQMEKEFNKKEYSKNLKNLINKFSIDNIREASTGKFFTEISS